MNSAPAPGAPSRSRLAALDALRAVAVLLVMGRHFEEPTTDVPEPLATVLRWWNDCGWMGVDLFFVLSGFLVSGLLFAEHARHGSIQGLRFLARRGFKIYPGFYLLLAVTWLWFRTQIPAENFVHEALFVQNYFPYAWNHTWSLAVEEHFYVALTVLLVWLSRSNRGPAAFRGVPLLVLAGAVLAYALRLETWTTERPRFLMLPTHLRFDSLFFGVGLAYGWHHHREAMEAWILPRRRALGLAGALLLVPCAVMPLAGDFTVNTLGLTFNYLGFGALLLVALTAPGEPAGLTRALARMGYFSYSIYLWHMPVNTAVRAWIEPSLGHLAGMACYLVGSVAVGILMARLVELPMLRLRDRLLPSRSAAAPAAALAGAALP